MAEQLLSLAAAALQPAASDSADEQPADGMGFLCNISQFSKRQSTDRWNGIFKVQGRGHGECNKLTFVTSPFQNHSAAFSRGAWFPFKPFL